jgi:hypothetical protein
VQRARAVVMSGQARDRSSFGDREEMVAVGLCPVSS